MNLAVLVPLLFLGISTIHCVPTYNLAEAVLPTPRALIATVYDGDDAIYILGGMNPGSSDPIDEILKYTISTDSIDLVGHLASPNYFIRSNAVTINSAGIIHAFGAQYGIAVTEFDTSTHESKLVGNFSIKTYYSICAPQAEDGFTFIGSSMSDFGGHALQINLTTMDVTYVDNVYDPNPHFQAPAFHRESQTLYSVVDGLMVMSKYRLGSEQSETIAAVPTEHMFYASDAVWVNEGKMYMLDVLTSDLTNECIGVFDPSPPTFYTLPMNCSSERFVERGVVYADKWNRIYVFGGRILNEGYATDKIYYVQLDGDVTSNPTTQETTENPEPSTPYYDFSCVGRPDGFYPHLSDCSAFVSCVEGKIIHFTCPTPFLFDPILLSCRYPDDVICELSCVGKANGLYPHPRDCSLFLNCRDDRGQVLPCPEPLLFDPVGLRCDYLIDCNATWGQ